jgi:hypothetical protein
LDDSLKTLSIRLEKASNNQGSTVSSPYLHRIFSLFVSYIG